MKLQSQIDQLLAQRASEWHQILEHASDAERAEFVAWLKQSPLHVKEYLETVYTDQVLNQVDHDKAEDIDALLAQIAPNVAALPSISPSSSTTKPRARWWPAALAAALAALAIAVPLIYQQTSIPDYSTKVGEQRTIELADASLITLNVDSRVQVRLDANERDIDLLRGEALFKVAHDANRPFKVQTRTAVIQAIGTQFNVYEKPDGTRVSVLEGRVKVDSAVATLSLGAGEEAQVHLDGRITSLADADVRRTVAWRERRLVFADTPLEDMVHEFNRYSRTVRLRIEGVPPGTHHYNGIFDASDPESLADLLSKEPDLALQRRDGEIVILPR